MFRNYFIVAVRNLVRQKLYTFINIFGLALGIAYCLLMVLFIKNEWSYDRFHKNKNQIYRVLSREVSPNGDIVFKSLHPPSLVETMARTFPGIQHVSGFMTSIALISGGDKTFSEQFGEVHGDFLKIFDFPLVAGDIETVLAQPDAVIISTSMAQKYFGAAQKDYGNIIGKTLVFHGLKDETFVITGVMRTIPENSSLRFNFLIPIERYENYGRNSAGGKNVASIYVMLYKEQDPAALAAASPGFLKTQQADRFQLLLNNNTISNAPDAYSLRLQPLPEIYWNSPPMNAYEERGNPFAAYLLFGIAILVLLVACSNYTTLSIGTSISRSREVGIRKTVGAHRRQIFGQFWGEALLLSFLSLALAMALTELFLPVFNEIIQKQLHIEVFQNSFLLLIALGIAVAIGLMAGSYPALVLSRYQTVNVLKKNIRIVGRSPVTNGLVILQFSIAIALLICIGVMIQQQRYMQFKDLGFDKENIVVVEIPGLDRMRDNDGEWYKQALRAHSHIVSAAFSDRSLTRGSASTILSRPNGTNLEVRVQRIDPGYIETMGLTLLEGRNFSRDLSTDRTEAILVNETLVKTAGITDPIGKPLMGFKGFKQGQMENPIIIGVVRDFHTGPLYEKIPPLVMQMSFSWGMPTVLIRIKPDDIPGTLALLKKVWRDEVPGREFNASFMDANVERQYRNEQRWQRILSYSAFFTIAISCLGLFGLISLAVKQRTKEIGIRKALGGSVSGVVFLLLKEFNLIIIISTVIAWPIAYYAMNRWLQTFAYRIHLTPMPFLLAGLIALLIALATVSFQAIKAARANPVEALRYE